MAAATAAAAAEPLPRAAAVTSLAAHPQQPGVLLVGRADGSVAVTGADGELLREWPAPWAATEAAEPRAVATVAWLPARGASAAVAVDEGGRVAVWTAIAGRCAAPAVLRIGGDVGDAALLATAVAAGGRALLWLTVGGATGCLPI